MARRLPIPDLPQLQALATLARLRLPPERQRQLAGRLQALLAAFAALAAADTEQEPGETGPEPELPLRPDSEPQVLPAESVLANAPSTLAGAFLVPRTVDG